MKKFVLKYGLISGALLSVMMVISQAFVKQFGLDFAMVIGYSTMVVSFLMVYFGVRAYRDSVLDGVIGFGTAFRAGILITLISTLCYVATWEVIYFGGFAKDFEKEYAAHTIEKAKAEGKTQAEIDEQTRKMEEFQVQYKNPFINAGYTFLEPLPVGLLFTLISAGVLSRKKRTRQSAPESISTRMHGPTV